MAGPEKDGGTIHPPKPPLITPKTTTVSKATFPMSLETRLITNCPISTPDKPSTRYYVAATSIKPQKTVPTQPPHHDTTLCNTKNLPAPQHKNQSQKDEKNVLCYTDTPPPTTTTCLPSCPHLVNLSVNGKHNDRTQRTNTPAPRQYRLPKMGTKLNHIPPNTRKSTQLPSNFTPTTNVNPTAQKKMQIGTRLHDAPTINNSNNRKPVDYTPHITSKPANSDKMTHNPQRPTIMTRMPQHLLPISTPRSPLQHQLPNRIPWHAPKLTDRENFALHDHIQQEPPVQNMPPFATRLSLAPNPQISQINTPPPHVPTTATSHKPPEPTQDIFATLQDVLKNINKQLDQLLSTLVMPAQTSNSTTASVALSPITTHDPQSTLNYPGPTTTQFHVSTNLYDLLTVLPPTIYATFPHTKIYTSTSTKPTILQPIYSKKNTHSRHTYTHFHYQYPSTHCYIATRQPHTQDPPWYTKDLQKPP